MCNKGDAGSFALLISGLGDKKKGSVSQAVKAKAQIIQPRATEL